LIPKRLKDLLLSQQHKFKIIKNESSSRAAWWRCYGFPAQGEVKQGNSAG
jgi:hypothetical protein